MLTALVIILPLTLKAYKDNLIKKHIHPLISQQYHAWKYPKESLVPDLYNEDEYKTLFAIHTYEVIEAPLEYLDDFKNKWINNCIPKEIVTKFSPVISNILNIDVDNKNFLLSDSQKEYLSKNINGFFVGHLKKIGHEVNENNVSLVNQGDVRPEIKQRCSINLDALSQAMAEHVINLLLKPQKKII